MLVRVPASTANLGTGFDCVGIALGLYDEIEVATRQAGLEIRVVGEGAGRVPLDESHLIVRSIRAGLAEWGGELPGLVLECRNVIPHSRGLGSSAAAIVAGLAIAWELAHPGTQLDRVEVFRLANLAEGHPDNAGAAVLGGGLLAWEEDGQLRWMELPIAPSLAFRAFVPAFETPTAGARKVLPDLVPRSDAVHQATRSALLAAALSGRKDLLLPATDDRLHQWYRRELMSESYALLTKLRESGVAATISGAGPTVLAVGEEAELAALGDQAGFTSLDLPVGQGVQIVGASQ